MLVRFQSGFNWIHQDSIRIFIGNHQILMASQWDSLRFSMFRTGFSQDSLGLSGTERLTTKILVLGRASKTLAAHTRRIPRRPGPRRAPGARGGRIQQGFSRIYQGLVRFGQDPKRIYYLFMGLQIACVKHYQDSCRVLLGFNKIVMESDGLIEARACTTHLLKLGFRGI